MGIPRQLCVIFCILLLLVQSFIARCSMITKHETPVIWGTFCNMNF